MPPGIPVLLAVGYLGLSRRVDVLEGAAVRRREQVR
jgi:hypothetical protein